MMTTSFEQRRGASPESFQLGPFIVPRIWTGLWQLSSNAWGSAPSPKIRSQSELTFVFFSTPAASTQIHPFSFKTSQTSTRTAIGMFGYLLPTSFHQYVRRFVCLDLSRSCWSDFCRFPETTRRSFQVRLHVPKEYSKSLINFLYRKK